MSTAHFEGGSDMEPCDQVMRRFGVCNADDVPAVYQPGEFIDVEIRDEGVVVEVDCYSFLRQDSEEEFDVDQWEAEKLQMLQPAAMPARTFWKVAFGAARALLNGRAVQFSDGEELTLAQLVAGRRPAPTMTAGKPDGLASEAEIAAALGCTVEAVRERAQREGWPYWLDGGADRPMAHVTPTKSH